MVSTRNTTKIFIDNKYDKHPLSMITWSSRESCE